MSKKLLSALIASLFAAAPAFGQSADDPMRVQGTATLGGIHNNTSATDNAQLDLYQDLGNGVMSNVGVQGRNSTTWFQGYGENFGRDDQYMFLRGGVYDVFKSGVYLNDIPRTFSSSAYTPFDGSGGNLLTATFPLATLPTNPPTAGWNSFRLGYDRRDVGGYAEWQKNSPWYFRADAQPGQFQRHAARLRGQRHEPGQRLHRPRDPAGLQDEQLGRRGRLPVGQGDVLGALGLQQVRERERNAAVDQPVLRPDRQRRRDDQQPPRHDVPRAGQHVQQVHALRQLPRPAVAVRDLGALHVGEDDERHAARPDGAQHQRRLQQYAAGHDQLQRREHQPVVRSWRGPRCRRRIVNTRVYYYWTKLENKSDVVEYGNAPTTPLASGLGCGNLVVAGIPTQTVGNCENELYNYTKNNVGFDAWWKFAPGQRLGFGYDYINIDQTRVDYDKSNVNKVWVEYKNTMFDTLSGRLKYQYLKRDSTLNFSNDPLPNGGANNPNYLLPYTSAFDLQSNTTNLVKLTLDWTPMMNVGMSFEGNWAKVDFDDVTYGRTKSDRQGYFLSGYWNASGAVKLNAFGSWEEAKYPSDHRYIGTVAGGPSPPAGYCTTANPNCYDPFAPPSRQQLLQLELADQGQDVDVRRGRRLAGDGRAQADGVVPVHQQRGQRDVRRAEQHRDSRRRRFPSTTSTTASSSTST